MVRLRELLTQRSVRRGDFVLASGRRSEYYIDARLTTMSGEGQLLIGTVCWKILEKSGWQAELVGGMTMGADPVAYAIAAHATRAGASMDAFSVRREPKGHGTGKRIEGASVEGARVVVVDDTMTSGGSLLETIRVIRDAGGHVTGALVLVDREEGGAERLSRAGVPFAAAFAARDLLNPAAT